MNGRVRRTLGDLLLSAGAIAIVAVVLASADIRVREQIGAAVRSVPASGVTAIAAQVREAGSVLVVAAKTRSVEHAPLVSFAAVAAVLLLGMARR